MSMLGRLFNRWREKSLSSEFDEEIAFHLEQRVERNVRAGMDQAAARVEARRYFGNVMLARDEMRQARVSTWIDDLSADLRYAVRVFARQPLLTAIAVLTLSLGIGANAAIYSVLNAVLFRPLSFPHADRTMLVNESLRSGGGMSPTIPEILDIRARTRSLDGVTFWDGRDTQVDGGAEPARVQAARVDPALLPWLGVRPAQGRLLTEEDSAEGSARVLLLSDGFWRRNFGAAPDIVGRTMMVDGRAHMVVGVLPADLAFPWLSGDTGIYLPYPLVPLYTQRSGDFANVRRVMTIARVKPGVSFEAAAADLASIAAGLVAEHPQLYKDFGGAGNFMITLQPLREAIGESGRRPLLMLFGAVLLVLLIACVNAAQFLLSHAIEREPEVALRNALGAGRGRLVRQFLSETLLLAGSATALGVLQAFWFVSVLRAELPGMLMVGRIEVDLRVLTFAAALAIGTTILCGVMPSLRFSRTPLRAGLESRASTGRRGRARQVLIAIEVALSVLLLSHAGVMLRSLQILEQSHGGFSSESVTTMRIRGMGDKLEVTYPQYVDRIAAQPGIAHAAMSSSVLPGWAGTPFAIVGSVDDEAARSRQRTSYQMVSPDYFATLGIPLLAGRTFATTDVAGATPVAIINEEMARQYWPAGDPLGRQIRSGSGPREATLTIVGVVGNVRQMMQVQTGDVPQLYVSYLQQPEPNMTLLLRPEVGATLSLDAVKRAIWSVEPRQAVFSIRSLDDILSQSVQGQRLLAILFGTFAALAFVMSIGGIFAVISYLTSRRVKEIALRRAIGARHSDVIRLLAGQTFGWTLAGLAVGAAAAMVVSNAVRAMTAAVVPLSAPMVAITSGAYLAVVAVATLLPALQALRVDPASALRAE